MLTEGKLRRDTEGKRVCLNPWSISTWCQILLGLSSNVSQDSPFIHLCSYELGFCHLYPKRFLRHQTQWRSSVGRTGLSPTCCLTYVLGTGVAIFCIQGLEAVATVGPSLLHDIALATQHCLALKAAKVFHVPVPPLGFGAFIGEDDLEMKKPDG